MFCTSDGLFPQGRTRTSAETKTKQLQPNIHSLASPGNDVRTLFNYEYFISCRGYTWRRGHGGKQRTKTNWERLRFLEDTVPPEQEQSTMHAVILFKNQQNSSSKDPRAPAEMCNDLLSAKPYRSTTRDFDAFFLPWRQYTPSENSHFFLGSFFAQGIPQACILECLPMQK